MSNSYLESKFERESSLFIEIKSFTQLLFTNKMLRFKLESVVGQFPEMTEAKLIWTAPYFVAGLDGAFEYDPQIIYTFYKIFNPILNYSFPGEISDMQNFACEVGGYFNATGSHGVSELVQAMLQFLLYNAHVGYGLDISAYALTMRLDLGKQDFSSFYKAYFATILQCDITFESVWEVCRHYAEQIGASISGSNSIKWKQLAEFVHSLVDNHHERLQAIQIIAIEKQQTPALRLLYLQLLNKIQGEGILTVEVLIGWLDEEITFTNILTLLTQQKIKKLDLGQQILDKLRSLPLNEEEKILRLQVWLMLLESNIANEFTFKEQIVEQIKAHFEDATLVDLSFSLLLLGGNVEAADIKYKILIEFLDSSKFKANYLKNMGLFFIHYKSPQLFFNFIKSACIKLLSVKEVEKSLESIIQHYRIESLIEFEREVIFLCIDSEGICRLLGQNLLFDPFRLVQTATVSYDINQLNLMQQYKLVISLLAPYHPIIHTIPVVLKLLNSPSPIVRELIACKLEELIPGYKFEVIEQVENNLSDDHCQKDELLNRLQVAWTDLAETLHKKNSINEFDPHLSETENMRSYHRSAAKASQQIAKKVRKEYKGISSIFKTIQVARGGGSVLHDGSVQPMGSHSISFTLPRTMFITPERNDYEMNLLYSSNWDKEFEPWEQTILLSGSI